MGAHGSKRFKDSLRALRADDPALRVLDCDGERLGDAGARIIAKALRRNRHLRGLKLGNCRITDAGLVRLTRVLCSNEVVFSHLRTLDFSTSSNPPVGNAFGDEGARQLAELLGNLHSLKYLRAADCAIRDEGAVFVADALSRNTSLKTLDLSHNLISDIGAEQIGQALQTNRTLEGLYLWHNRVFHSGAEALALALASNNTLKSLGLGCNSIGDEGVKALSLALLSVTSSSQLVWLGLGGNHITDKGAEHIAALLRPQKPLQNGPLLQEDHSSSAARLQDAIRMSGLRPLLELGVTPSQVSLTKPEGDDGGAGDGVGPVEPRLDQTNADDLGDIICCPLESLGLGGNQIGDDGVKLLVQALYSNTNLQCLGLADNRIGDSGAAAVANLLLHTSTLVSIILSGNDIHDDGGSKVVAALSQNTSLQKLYLAQNPIGDIVGRQCIEVIGHLNTTLQVLDLHNTRMSAPTVSSLVQTMRDRHVLRALGTQPVPMPGLKGVYQPPAGNMLAMKDWQPPPSPSFHELLRKRRSKMQSSGAILHRTTVQALESLPEPQETAQTLVIKSGEEEVTRRKSYRRSISNLWKRLSRSRTHDITPDLATNSKRTSKLRGKGKQDSIELNQMNEENDGTRLIEETQAGEEEGEDTFNISMFSGSGESPNDDTEHDSNATSETNKDNSVVDDQQVAQPISPTHQSSMKEIKASNLSFRSQKKTIAPLELEPISEDMTSSEAAMNTGAPLLEGARNEGEAPVLGPRKDREETLLSETTSHSQEPTRDAIWQDPIQEDEVEASVFASQNLPLSQQSSENGHEMALQRNPHSMSKSQSFHNYERSLDDVARSSSLKSLTKNRARPSYERRPPTRSSSKSSIASGGGETQTARRKSHRSSGILIGSTSTKKTASIYNETGAPPISNGGGATSTEGERLNGSMQITDQHDISTEPTKPLKLDEEEEKFAFDAAKRMLASSKPIVNSQDPALAQNGKEEKPLKEQWIIALAKRVGILKMESFLHNAFEVLQSSTSAYEYNNTHARLLRNIPKNRDGAPLPTSHARVKLQLVFEEVGSDYINASIAGPPGLPPTFIITQYPLESTIDDFWRMVWEHRLSILVLLNEQDECPAFWPEGSNVSQHPLVVEGSWVDDALTVQSAAGGSGGEETGIPGTVLKRFTLNSSIENETQLLTIFQYTKWPQRGVPESPRDVARILHLARRVKEHTRTIAPTIVMSTLGAGRAGCFCVTGIAYEMLKTSDPAPPTWDKDPNLLDQVIRGLRLLRAGLVETSQQFEACHRILEEAMWGHVEEEGGEAGGGKESKSKGKMWKIFGRKKQTAAAFKNAKGKKGKRTKDDDDKHLIY